MKYTQRTTHKAAGFTIIELLVATMVFSVILLLVTTGVLQIGKTFYKGALQSRTQRTARNIIDEIGRGIQFSGEEVVPTTPVNGAASPYPRSGGNYAFCINGIGYSFILDRQLDPAPPTGDKVQEVLISFVEPCSGFDPTLSGVTSKSGRELLGVGMRLTELSIVDNRDKTFTITVGVASGERDLFNPAAGIATGCKSGAGQQFCAVSRLSTTVQKRIE